MWRASASLSMKAASGSRARSGTLASTSGPRTTSKAGTKTRSLYAQATSWSAAAATLGRHSTRITLPSAPGRALYADVAARTGVEPVGSHVVPGIEGRQVGVSTRLPRTMTHPGPPKDLGRSPTPQAAGPARCPDGLSDLVGLGAVGGRVGGHDGGLSPAAKVVSSRAVWAGDLPGGWARALLRWCSLTSAAACHASISKLTTTGLPSRAARVYPLLPE